MASNLPPGVTVSMIPGNRPEDIAEEEFWNQLFAELENEGFAQDAIDAIDDETSPLSHRAIEIARDLGYNLGYNDGKTEANMAISEEEMHVSELVYAWHERHPRIGVKKYLRQEGIIRKHVRRGTIEYGIGYGRKNMSIEDAKEIHSDELGNPIHIGTFVIYGEPDKEDIPKWTAEVIEISDPDSDYDDNLQRGVTYPPKAVIKFADGETETVSSSYTHHSSLARYWEIEGVEQGVWEFGDITVVDQEKCEHEFVHHRSVSGRQTDGQDVTLDIEKCRKCGLEQAG